jgi:hypothetical protein
VIAFTFHYNVDLHTSGAVLWNPIVAGIWILVGLVIVLAFPAVARRAGAGLARSEGLAVGAPDAPSSATVDPAIPA